MSIISVKFVSFNQLLTKITKQLMSSNNTQNKPEMQEEKEVKQMEIKDDNDDEMEQCIKYTDQTIYNHKDRYDSALKHPLYIDDDTIQYYKDCIILRPNVPEIYKNDPNFKRKANKQKTGTVGRKTLIHRRDETCVNYAIHLGFTGQLSQHKCLAFIAGIDGSNEFIEYLINGQDNTNKSGRGVQYYKVVKIIVVASDMIPKCYENMVKQGKVKKFDYDVYCKANILQHNGNIKFGNKTKVNGKEYNTYKKFSNKERNKIIQLVYNSRNEIEYTKNFRKDRYQSKSPL